MSIHDCIHSPFWNKGGPSDLFDDNNVDWAPSLNLGHETSLNVSDTEARYERAMRRNTVKQQEDQECNSETMVEEQMTDLEPQPEQDINDNEVQQTLKKNTTGMCTIKSGQHCFTKREGKDANKTTTGMCTVKPGKHCSTNREGGDAPKRYCCKSRTEGRFFFKTTMRRLDTILDLRTGSCY